MQVLMKKYKIHYHYTNVIKYWLTVTQQRNDWDHIAALPL